MVQENALPTNTTSLYVIEIEETHSEVNDIQNNQTENFCQEVCRLQEINAPQDQLMISDTQASALFADLRLQRAPLVEAGSACQGCSDQPPGTLQHFLHLTGKPELSDNQ